MTHPSPMLPPKSSVHGTGSSPGQLCHHVSERDGDVGEDGWFERGRRRARLSPPMDNIERTLELRRKCVARGVSVVPAPS